VSSRRAVDRPGPGRYASDGIGKAKPAAAPSIRFGSPRVQSLDAASGRSLEPPTAATNS